MRLKREGGSSAEPSLRIASILNAIVCSRSPASSVNVSAAPVWGLFVKHYSLLAKLSADLLIRTETGSVAS